MKKRYTLKYKRSHGRRRSTVHITDSYTNVTEILHMEKPIGSGSYGTVRLFSNQTMKLAVKTNLLEESFSTEKETSKFKRDIKREYTLTKIAYPDDLYQLKIHESSDVDLSDENVILVDYHFVMPYIKGTVLFSIEYTVFSSEHIIKLFMRIAQELFRLHQLGIIHGDVNANNIKYQPLNNSYEFKIRFLDFGLAHRESEYVNLDCPTTLHLAPEIAREEPLLANANQDVYSLAELYDNILFEIPVTRSAIEHSYPIVRKFIVTAQDLQSDRRPKLQDFIYDLALQILDQSRENLDSRVKKLIRAIFTNNKTKVTEIVTTADDEMEKEIIKLAALLITHHFYTEASALLNVNVDLLQRHKHHTGKLFEISFANRHLPVFLFTQLLVALSDEYIRNRLLRSRNDDHMPIQFLAKNNRRDLITILFKHLSWHNIYTLSEEHIDSIDTLPSDLLKLLIDLALLNAEYEFKVENEMGYNVLAPLSNCFSNENFRLSGDLLAAVMKNNSEFDTETIQQIKSNEILNTHYKRLKSCLKQDVEGSIEHRRAHHRK